jgi:DNA-binding NtrC family response regulator
MTERHSRVAIVVDDDPLVLEVLSGMLQHLKWLVTTACNAEDVLASDILPAPNILVTDVNLGKGLDGFALSTKARHRWPDIGVVVISGRPPSPQQLNTLRSQDIFLFKPVTLSALTAAIARVCD